MKKAPPASNATPAPDAPNLWADNDATIADPEAMAVIENHHRAAMSVPEEARAAQRQLHRNHGDVAETAAGMGWTPETLARRLALLACTPAVLKALTHRQIQLGHAELLCGVLPDMQDRVLAGLLAHKGPVAVLKSQLGQYARRLAGAIFDTAQCATCPHNSSRQAGLFAESIGEGHCQHPTHFDELTQQAVEAKASALCVEYPVVHVVRPGDGFTPLHVSAEGELGVGATQYAACQGCKSFGCAVSAMPGSYGVVTPSLCFDAACNSQKVAQWRKASREEAGPRASGGAEGNKGKRQGSASSGKTDHKQPTKALPARPTNQTPQRVVEYRIAQWRKWVAAALMAQPQRSHRVLIALTLAGRGADLRAAQFEKALAKIADHNPQIIFVDIMMPRLDGYQACALIKNNQTFKTVPVIMLSSKDGLFDKARGRIVGSEQYLTKPFTREELLGAIRKYVNA